MYIYEYGGPARRRHAERATDDCNATADGPVPLTDRRIRRGRARAAVAARAQRRHRLRRGDGRRQRRGDGRHRTAVGCRQGGGGGTPALPPLLPMPTSPRLRLC